ncbi:uncharacterized protein N7496_001464 [Penicillium cataractarum]|uniref:Xylanolytic transcriptional activator regulatory domain-containing protein n=1 Tax=Penicillium cataractarum TaxID=2100454 RepID=A0A9X0B6Y5_9EURO|nr:uncharacterized protein N7496_001464 [Penicillium cataractarum]KAJ5390396.1 hypothetical protein N7496_001464 [Penicillium cataractarum]
MEQRLREQSLALEAREEALPLDASAMIAISDYNDTDHCSGVESQSVTAGAPAADKSALSDPPGGFRGSSVDAVVQTPQRPSTTRLRERTYGDDQVVETLAFDCFDTENVSTDVTKLEQPLLQALIDFFYQSIYSIFPIIHRRRFQPHFDHWSSYGRDNGPSAADHDFQPLLYALLAVAASVMPENHPIFENSSFEIYKWMDLGDLLYHHAISLSAGRSCQESPSAAINTIAAQGLLSLYLIERGKVNDAWVTAGHAIRLYQGFDLEDNVSAASDAKDLRLAHRNLWWCLYILDRSLSTALLKPLAIDDAESDIESCDGEEYLTPSTLGQADLWFSVVADFHITMGRIYRSVRLIRKAESSRNANLKDTVRSHVKRHDAELEKYYKDQVLPKIETSNSQVGPLALQTIAVSSYYIGLVLLYRTFIERFDITEPDSLLRCAEAASNCIKVTPQVIAHVPASHFVIQQSRAIFASTKVLLHCMRLARNPSFTRKAWSDVESGLKMLREVKIQWPEIKKYQLLTEEDMHHTQTELHKHDLYYKTFDSFGQTLGTGETSERATPPFNRTYPSQRPKDFLDLQGLDNLQWELSNGTTNSVLATESSQIAVSAKHSQPEEPSQQQSKRRKLRQFPSQSPLPVNDTLALDLLPMLRDSTDCPIMDHMITTGDLLLPDISPRSTNSEELSTSFFGDALLMTSIDQFFSQSEA